MINKLYTITLLSIIFLSSCTDVYVPKPEGYHKIDLPEHKYITLQQNQPYSFEHSIYAIARPHKKSSVTEDTWIDIVYPDFNASIELTYKEVNESNDFNKMINDARKLTNKHNIKAYAIDETTIKNSLGINASLFELEGDVPSQFQFYATDSTNHFFRGALYFETAVKNDSLRPIIDYISFDIVHMINTLSWKEGEKN